jgi:hypothetical protein
MGYRHSRELARIRSELRARLLAHRYDGAQEILKRLEQAANSDSLGSPELRNEYARWRMRFQMRAHA